MQLETPAIKRYARVRIQNAQEHPKTPSDSEDTPFQSWCFSKKTGLHQKTKDKNQITCLTLNAWFFTVTDLILWLGMHFEQETQYVHNPTTKGGFHIVMPARTCQTQPYSSKFEIWLRFTVSPTFGGDPEVKKWSRRKLLKTRPEGNIQL